MLLKDGRKQRFEKHRGKGSLMYTYDDIDTQELRDKLTDYYGTAMVNGFPMAMADLNGLDRMDDEEIRELAEELGITE